MAPENIKITTKRRHFLKGKVDRNDMIKWLLLFIRAYGKNVIERFKQ